MNEQVDVIASSLTAKADNFKRRVFFEEEQVWQGKTLLALHGNRYGLDQRAERSKLLI